MKGEARKAQKQDREGSL